MPCKGHETNGWTAPLKRVRYFCQHGPRISESLPLSYSPKHSSFTLETAGFVLIAPTKMATTWICLQKRAMLPPAGQAGTHQNSRTSSFCRISLFAVSMNNCREGGSVSQLDLRESPSFQVQHPHIDLLTGLAPLPERDANCARKHQSRARNYKSTSQDGVMVSELRFRSGSIWEPRFRRCFETPCEKLNVLPQTCAPFPWQAGCLLSFCPVATYNSISDGQCDRHWFPCHFFSSSRTPAAKVGNQTCTSSS